METNQGDNQADQANRAERTDILEAAFAEAVAAVTKLRAVLRERAPFLEELELRLCAERDSGRRATLYGSSIYWTTSAYGYRSIQEFASECEKKPADRALALAALKERELEAFKSLEVWRKQAAAAEAEMLKSPVIEPAATNNQ